MVQRMVGPSAVSANQLSSEVGISQSSLSKWLRESGSRMGRVSRTPPPSDRDARRPEDWSAEERLRVVMEASRLRDEELRAFLRREGIHEATLAEWKASVLEALGSPRKVSAESKRVRELEKQLRRKDKALAETAALLVLQKKV